jgi:hypothetical protein
MSPFPFFPFPFFEGSDGFVTSTVAPIATGWNDQVAGRESHPLKIRAFPRRTMSPFCFLSLVMRRVIILIHQGTSPIVQEQNGLFLVLLLVEISEKPKKNFELDK